MNKDHKKALVTGGCGFIGSNLVVRLLKEGFEVGVLDVAAKEGLVDERGVRFFRGDMNSKDVLKLAVVDADVVFHLAWSTIPKTSNEDPIFDVNSNISGSLRLLSACAEKKVTRVVFISSGGTVYGVPDKVPIEENFPLQPMSSYGITKLAVEKYLALFRRLGNLDYVILRPSNPYGPLQNPFGQVGTVAVFMHRVLNGAPVRIWGDGKVVRDYLFIDDLVDLIFKAGVSDVGEERIFNASSNQGVSLVDLLDKIAAVTGKEPNVIFEPGRIFDAPINILSNTRALEHLGWCPKTTLESGLKKTCSWMSEWAKKTGV